MKKKFSFEDELAIENKGLAAYIEIINSIKKLNDFNEDLYRHFLKYPVVSEGRKKDAQENAD